MKFNEFKHLAEAKEYGSKQEVIDHFVRQGKSAAAGAAAWERGWRGPKPKAKKLTGPVRSYHDDLDDKRYGETNEDSDPCWKNYKQIGMKKKGGKQVPNCVPKESVESLEAQLAEAALGVAPKRPVRSGSRPDRGHIAEPRYKKAHSNSSEHELEEHKKGVRAHKYTKKAKGTVDHSKVYMNSPNHKTIGPKEIAKLEKELHEVAKLEEGAKVDRMVKHIAKSERKLGHSKDEAEDIAWATANKRGMLNNKNKKKVKEHTEVCEFCGGTDHTSLDESGKASRSLCTSSKPDADLGASQLASCKSQGLRARDGKKSHKVGKTRVTMGGHKIKGRKYGGPLPDWS